MNQALKNHSHYNLALVFLCFLVLVLFGLDASPGVSSLAHPGAENSYYNLLIQGFNARQLNIITRAPDELTRLANPYDDPKFSTEFSDLSYYKGKLYLYYGVAPAIVLYWPFFFVTGNYISDQSAIFIFLSTGFLALAFLLNSVWKRYFENAGFWILGLCILAAGLAIGAIEAEWWGSDYVEVSQSAGFAFTMLSLVAIWQAMHQANRKAVWLLLASFTYGLAIASRSSLLFGAIILLIPIIYESRNLTKSAAIRKIGPLFFAIACPMVVIGTGLMIYNFARFGNVMEFGWRYCLGNGTQELYRNGQFHWHFFWYNFYYYFLEPMRWTTHFPFLQTYDPPVPPVGHAATGKDCGGILLVNFPLALTGLAAALAWRLRKDKESAPLRLLVLICQ